MRKKLIIFDCDGVLVDSEYLESRLFSEILASYGLTMTMEETIRRFTGVNEGDAREMISRESGIVLPSNYWSSQIPKLHNLYETELNGLMRPVLETLDLLNLPRCVASNSSPTHINHCLKFSGQSHYFPASAIFSSHQVEKPKPAPDVFLFAAHKMGFIPEDCIVVEDSQTGIQAAMAAGMEVMIFLGGTHAGYDWYREDMLIYNQPIFSSCHELSEAIRSRI